MKRNLLLIAMLILSTVLVAQNKRAINTERVVADKVVLNGLEDVKSMSNSNSTFVPVKHFKSGVMSQIEVEETEIGKTVYDWHTNSGARNNVVTWEDGWAAAVFTQALSKDGGHADRGTGYAYYDGNKWHKSESRIEDEKTGFGNVSRYKDGVIVAAHGGNTIVLSICDDRTGSSWKKVSLPVTTAAWPSIMTSGENRDIIHMITCSGLGNHENCWYFRSTDGGETWDFFEHVIEYFSPEYTNHVGSNTTYFLETTDFDDPNIPNRIAFVACDSKIDGQVVYSDDDGLTWNRHVFYEHPFPGIDFLGESIYYPRMASAAWDAFGELHVVFEYNTTQETEDGFQYSINRGGIVYWNENMPARDTNYIVDNIVGTDWIIGPALGQGGIMPPEYVGYTVPIDPITKLPFTGDDNPENWPCELTDLSAHGRYNCGHVAMPAIAIDKENHRIAVAFISIADHYMCAETEYYFKIFLRVSEDYGDTWSEIEMLTKGIFHFFSENVYPWMSGQMFSKKHKTLHLVYQQDQSPGTDVQDQELVPDEDDNFFYAMNIDMSDYISIKDYEDQATSIKMEVYPNPATSFTTIYLETEAQINIYNSVGQTVKSFNHNGGYAEIEVESLKTGVYYVVANCGSATQSVKLVVQ